MMAECLLVRAPDGCCLSLIAMHGAPPCMSGMHDSCDKFVLYVRDNHAWLYVYICIYMYGDDEDSI
jgi:hypothetical protein